MTLLSVHLTRKEETFVGYSPSQMFPDPTVDHITDTGQNFDQKRYTLYDEIKSKFLKEGQLSFE